MIDRVPLEPPYCGPCRGIHSSQASTRFYVAGARPSSTAALVKACKSVTFADAAIDGLWCLLPGRAGGCAWVVGDVAWSIL
jgi:hypothetical protein